MWFFERDVSNSTEVSNLFVTEYHRDFQLHFQFSFKTKRDIVVEKLYLISVQTNNIHYLSALHSNAKTSSNSSILSKNHCSAAYFSYLSE